MTHTEDRKKDVDYDSAVLTKAERETLTRHLHINRGAPNGPAATEMKAALIADVEHILTARAGGAVGPSVEVGADDMEFVEGCPDCGEDRIADLDDGPQCDACGWRL